MSILVIGKTGQVARELQRLGGEKIIALDRQAADLTNPDACAEVIRKTKARVIINAAAYTAVDQAETEGALAHQINADAPGAMAQAAAARDLPFLHISTDYVFDGRGQSARAETDPVDPINAYGRSKLAGENAVREAFEGAKAGHVILRTSWVFSAHRNNFVKTMLRLSKTRSELSVVADQIGGPTPATAIAEALLVMADGLCAGKPGGIYHFTGAPNVSWADFARAIFDQSGSDTNVTDIATTQYPTPAPRPLNSRLDCSLIAADFGILQPDWAHYLAADLAAIEQEENR